MRLFSATARRLRGPRARVAAGVIAVLAGASAPPAVAQQAALNRCITLKPLDERIAACSDALKSEKGARAAQAHHFRALAFHDKGNLDRAMADYDESLRLDPGNANATNNRGIAWQAKGDLDRAIADHGQALRLDPQDSSGAYRFRSQALRLKGELDRAIADASAAIKLYPDYNAAYVARGLAYEDKKDPERARADYAKALAMPPKYFSGPMAHKEARDRIAALDQAKAAPKAAPAAPPTFRRRVALVIGNSAYAAVARLPNPVNDAGDVAAALRRIGFEVVEGKDLDRRGMDAAMREFNRKLDGADLALLFYAGHGLQVNGKNYLLPVDAKVERPGDLAIDAVELGTVLAQMEQEKRVNLIFLDACRDNPLARSLATRSVNTGTGLASQRSPIGTMIAYATQPDNVALDGEGRNSPFTTALLRHIGSRNVDIGILMRRVRAEVIALTRERQVPWDHSSLVGEVVLAR